MGKVYDWEDLDKVFQPIAEEAPGRTSPETVYYHWNGDIPEKPCCAVAVLLDGLPDFDPLPVKSWDDRPGISPEVSNFFWDGAFADRFTPAARQYLMSLQFMQDQGNGWGFCRNRAVARARDHSALHNGGADGK